MLLQRGCPGGQSPLNLLRCVGRAEQSWWQSQAEQRCSQHSGELSLSLNMACCASEVGGGSALAEREQSSLLIALKGQFLAVWTGLTAPSDLQRCVVGCGGVSCLVLPFLTTQVKCTGISPLLLPEVLLSAGWKPISVWASYKKRGSTPV